MFLCLILHCVVQFYIVLFNLTLFCLILHCNSTTINSTVSYDDWFILNLYYCSTYTGRMSHWIANADMFLYKLIEAKSLDSYSENQYTLQRLCIKELFYEVVKKTMYDFNIEILVRSDNQYNITMEYFNYFILTSLNISYSNELIILYRY